MTQPPPRLRAWIAVALIALASPARGEDAPAPAAKPEARAQTLRFYPGSLSIDGPRDARRFLVTGVAPDGTTFDATAKAEIVPHGNGLAVGPDGYITGAKDGEYRVSIRAAGASVDAQVKVSNSAKPEPIGFVRDVQPILTKLGCNQGTCHGSAKGKNGFKLSLRGYDLAWDYQQLIDDLAGRRFNRVAPEQSLMLLKPTMGVPHQGGQVLEPDSDYYRVLRGWIAEGVRSDVGKVERVSRLEVYPTSIDFGDAYETQQLLVIAHYPDGKTRDVTREAGFESSVPTVATVDKLGLIQSERRGEASVLVRYEGVFAVANLTVMGRRDGFSWDNPPTNNTIDELVHKKLQRMKILASPTCDDAEFLRRVYLDLVGVPPTAEQVRAFLDDTTASKDKRDRVIDALIASPEFTANWTHRFADLLQVNRKLIGEKATWAFMRWIEGAVSKNMPYDRMVAEVVTAEGSSYDHPAVNYFRANKEPSVSLENATQLFLGIRFSCNKCHDHPFERWTQGQYYGMAAYWGQVGVKNGMSPGEQIVFDRGNGEVTHPRDGRVMPPTFPYAYEGQPQPAADSSRRAQLASWLTSEKNPYFARSFANRIWSYFLGRGIIDPVDDIRQSNPPSNPELLDWLEKDFIASGFDYRHLIRTICRSRAYQASIATNKFNEDDAINFSHASPRRLTAEQLMDAILIASGKAPKFDGVPAGFRANQLPDSQAGSGGFLDLFGRPARETPCECERSSEVSLSQALNLINGPTISDAIIDPEGRIARLMKANPDDARVVEEMYLAALCRRPTEAELAKGKEYLAQSPSKAEGAQDLLWALFNSPGFLFNR